MGLSVQEVQQMPESQSPVPVLCWSAPRLLCRRLALSVCHFHTDLLFRQGMEKGRLQHLWRKMECHGLVYWIVVWDSIHFGNCWCHRNQIQLCPVFVVRHFDPPHIHSLVDYHFGLSAHEGRIQGI